MKKAYVLFATLVLSIVIGCYPDGRRSVSVHRRNGNVKFQAEFASKMSPRIRGYIEKQLPMIAFDRSPNTDSSYSSADTMRFSMETEQGFVEIAFSDQENSKASFQKLESVCRGIKNEVSK